MFAKLKKKIQEEDGSGPGSPLGPGLASPVRTDPGPRSPSLPTGSGYTSSTEEPNTTTKEDILKLLMKRTEQCKKLETKVTEYVTVIKDKNRNIEKLELSLEKQQDAMSQRMQDLNEQYQTNRVKLTDGFKKTLVQREQEFSEKIAAIEEEKLLLEKQLKDRLYQREEENEEMQGLATQETAKVKHMLLNTQEELASCKKSLEEKSSQIQQLEKSSKELETTVEALKSSLEEVTKERDKFCESGGVQADLVTSLTAEKRTVENQLVKLSEELQQKTARILQLESSNADLESRYVTLERNGDLNRNKTSRLLEEKSDEIDRLQERLRTLEERLQGQGLSGDERVTALERERESLEEKLSETRHQLTEVKSTWSDKITQLEDQVSHLNQKIAEDSEELAQGQETITSMTEKFHAQLEDVKSRLEDAESRALENWELANQKDVQYEKEKVAMESQMAEQKALAEKREAELTAEITSLESELSSLQANLEQEKHLAVQKFDELGGKYQEMLERCLEAEKMTRRLEDECSQLKEKLIHEQGECNSANEELERKQDRITMLQERVSVVEKEKWELDVQVKDLQHKADKQQSELTETSQDKDDLMLRNAELSQQLEKLRVSSLEERKELQEEIQQKSDAVVSLQDSLKEREEKVVGLEGQIKATEDEQNRTTVSIRELESLEQNIAGLEDQLNEKNKTIKMQQQRLTDLKKTLQRELKVQTLPNDLPIDSKDFAASPPTQRRNVTKSSAISNLVTHPAILPMSAGNSTTTNSSHSPDLSDDHSNSFRESLQDDVNFEYLKHVVLKFMLSREAEALQLIKAVSVLLRFSSEEQRLIRDTLEWKMSWFGARPPLGSGQKSKIIPSNY